MKMRHNGKTVRGYTDDETGWTRVCTLEMGDNNKMVGGYIDY